MSETKFNSSNIKRTSMFKDKDLVKDLEGVRGFRLKQNLGAD